MYQGVVPFICLVICTFADQSDGAIKRWVPNSNFANANNWKLGRVPCSRDVVKFPVDSGIVYIQTNISVQEIILPTNGELILSEYMSISFPSAANTHSNDECDGQDIEYNGTVAQSWFDPGHWCETSDIHGACMTESPARLHTEYLPCQKDIVVFPVGSGFRVDLASGVDIHVGRLSFRDKEFTTGDFRKFSTSGRGTKEFLRSPHGGATTVNIGGNLCSDPTGCPCDNDGGQLEEKVCGIQAATCPQLTCNSPLLPLGHCCHICGAILMIDYDVGFKFKSLEDIIHSIIPRSQRNLVDVIISRLVSEQIQVVIININGDAPINTVVTAIEDKIKPDDKGYNRYKVTKIRLITSGDEGSPQTGENTAGRSMMSGGSIASIVVAILIILAIILVAMYCLIDRKHTPDDSSRLARRIRLPTLRLPPAFRRFSGRHDDRSDMELPSIGFNDNIIMVPESSGTIRGFDNPTYDTSSHPEVVDVDGGPVSTIDVSQPTFLQPGSSTGFSNPMYGAQGKVEDISYLDSSVKINPMFSGDGLEEDSEI